MNIDADDYLKSNTIYQVQLEMLMAHPECSMCMQDVWQVDDGVSDEKGIRWPSLGKLQNGQILQTKQIVSQYRALNQCYMIRRHPEVDCATLYGKHFDDTIITIHHLQFGPCVYVDRADYIWVQYNTSITKTLQGDDNVVEYGLLQLHHVRFIPTFASICMKEGLPEIIHMLKALANNNYQWSLTERTQAAYRETPGRIYSVFSHKHSTVFDRMFLRYVRIVVLLYSRCKFNNWKYLYSILISYNAMRNIEWKR